jgi:hypothetical protein
MEAVRKMIVRRSDRTRESMMAKEDMENVSDISPHTRYTPRNDLEGMLISGGIFVQSCIVGTSN